MMNEMRKILTETKIGNFIELKENITYFQWRGLIVIRLVWQLIQTWRLRV
ncbi:unnamed protein product [Tenebrio molitor]|nr:unnamed protein product [Tenebrio molitor]